MAERSLQKDNKLKKNGFFDIDEITEELATENQNENTDANNEMSAYRMDNIEKSESVTGQKKFIVGAAAFLSVLVILLVAAFIVSQLDFISNSDYVDDGLPESETMPPIVFEIYSPDWETDIFTDPEYLALSPERIEYSDDGGLSFSKIGPDGLEKAGGDKLVFLNSYFDAVKNGDHEAVNAMLTHAYIEKNGAYEDFPMQRVFNIRIERKIYNDSQYDNSEYEDYYFVVSYNILRNDGMFRSDCDDQYYCKTIMRVLMDDEGNGKIDLINNYYGS